MECVNRFFVNIHSKSFTTFLLCLESVVSASKSEQNKSIYFYVKKELLEDFNEQSACWDQLKLTLSGKFEMPAENIQFSPAADRPLNFDPDKIIYVVQVAEKALVTILFEGIGTAEMQTEKDRIINLLYLNTRKCKKSQIEIIQILEDESCKLVLRLPGLAMLHLMIAFFSQQTSPLFLQKLAKVLPESAYEVSFGFASLPDYPAKLPKLRPMPKLGDKTRHFIGHQQKGNFDNFSKL